MIRLGSFGLSTVIARGGMGEVWVGEHREQYVPVAVKVLAHRWAARPELKLAFRDEVRALAGLDHPSVVMVFDHGEIDEATAAASDGDLIEGTPFLAMEFLGGGTLDAVVGKLGWPALQTLVAWLLPALAHAHARGVVHLDLKPGNVLLETAAVPDDDGIVRRLGPGRLSDFGIAHLRRRQVGRKMPSTLGTPAYMAPEQIRGEWRDFGPWTDLYGLGCLLWALLTGEPPYGIRGHQQVVAGHLHRRLPALRTDPALDLPPDLESWLQRLLAKEPLLRFVSAADALQAFDEVCGQRSDWSWRDARRPRGAPLIGAGLGLYGLRAPPLVGREAEQQRLWTALTRVRDERRPAAVLLEGPAGCGKSRLAEWLTQRGAELGLVRAALRAVHSPGGGVADGLTPMVSEFLACDDLERPDAAAQIRRWLQARGLGGEEDVAALVELAAPRTQTGDGGRVVRFGDVQERWASLLWLLRRVSTEGLVVLVLDDVQWGGDALGFVRQVIERQWTDLPVLMVLTARDAALVEQPESSRLVDEIATSDRTERVRVGALGPTAHERMVRALLPLAPMLAGRVASRTAGNPLFAEQLVRDWVHRGALVLGEDGFRLRAGVDPVLPGDLQTAWRDRTERVLVGRPESQRIALESAAALGQEVSLSEYHEVCERVGAEVSTELLDALVRARLARWTRPGRRIAFAHGMLRETVGAMSAEAGRWEGLHRVCADVIEGAARVDLGRVARHRLAAGQDAQALDPLVVAAVSASDSGEFARAEELLTHRAAALDRLGSPEDRERVRQWLAEARLAKCRGRSDLAERLATRASTVARTRGWTDLLARACHGLGKVARMRGDLATSIRIFEEGADLARQVDDELLWAFCVLDGAAARLDMGSAGTAAVVLKRQALPIFERHQDLLGVALVWLCIAYAARNEGDIAEARHCVERARSAWERVGSRRGVADCANALGELARHDGDLEEAERAYRSALDGYRELGAVDVSIPLLNLGLVLVERERYDEALAPLEEALDLLEAAGRRGLVGLAHVVQLPCAAARGDLRSWDVHWVRSQALLAETGFVEVDIAMMAERAGTLMAAVDAERAVAVRGLARSQWLALGREEAVARLDSIEASTG